MSRYQEIADDLRRRIQAGEFAVGDQLPSIAALQEHYAVPSLNTVRAAHRVLEDEGMVDSRHGVGVFVTSTTSRRQVDVVASVASARDLLTTALAALTTPSHRVVIDLLDNDDTALVLTSALREWAAQQHRDADDAKQDGDQGVRNIKLRWAAEAERLADLVDAGS